MLPAMVLPLLIACTGTKFDTVASERGPDMVKVAGDVVLLGWKKAAPVAGFQFPVVIQPGGQAPGAQNGLGPQGGPQGGGPPGGPPGGGPSGGPQGPATMPDGSPVPPPPGMAPPQSDRAGPPHLPGGQQIPLPSGRVEQPDLGLAPGAQRNAGSRPMPDPLDPRDVRVDAFWIDLTEVTQAQFQEFVTDTGYRAPYVHEPWADEDGWNWTGGKHPAKTGDHPVVMTNWYDARAYCDWAGKRLPTEAEWQLAVLGPKDDERTFPWGDTYDAGRSNHGRLETPNYDDSDGWLYTSPVGAYPAGASRHGLQDAFGNAWEWTADIRVKTWEDYLGERDGDVIVDPHTGTTGLYAAVRGGAYFFDMRPNPAGERNGFLVELRRKTSGFRCARDT